LPQPFKGIKNIMIIKPFSEKVLTLAGLYAVSVIDQPEFRDVIAPLLVDVAYMFPRGEGYDPEEVYMHFIPGAGNTMALYEHITGNLCPDAIFHDVKACFARMVEFQYRHEIHSLAGAVVCDVAFPCDAEIQEIVVVY